MSIAFGIASSKYCIETIVLFEIETFVFLRAEPDARMLRGGSHRAADQQEIDAFLSAIQSEPRQALRSVDGRHALCQDDAAHISKNDPAVH
jgi:hypothetical protein